MKRFALLACAALAASFAASDAEAGRRDHDHHRGHDHNRSRSGFSISRSNNGFYSRYESRYYNRSAFTPSYRRSNRVWHDTSHYDYHPPEIIRHRNHYHYQPGHYDFHQTGHWDRYRH